MRVDPNDRHTDGNAVAGLFQEILAGEFTSAQRTCQSCGDRNPAGAHRSYAGAGIVLRCPNCEDVAALVTRLRDEYVFELRGTWTVPAPTRNA
jgi:Family of unknown function (DUF6510)